VAQNGLRGVPYERALTCRYLGQMYRSASTSKARLITSLATIVVVLALAGFTTHHGSSAIDLTVLVYAIPAVAIGIALFSAVAGRLFGVAPSRTVGRPAFRANALVGMAVGAIVLVVGGTMVFRIETDVHRYASDSACAAGFGAAYGAPGACRIAYGTIEDAYTTPGRYSSTYHLAIRMNDGTLEQVALGRKTRGDVWAGAEFHGDRQVTVQYFRTALVRVQTSSGEVETSALPAERLTLWAFVAIFGGVVGVISALRVAFGW